MKKLALSKYTYETIASGSGNQLPISSVCSARCIFCSNSMNPFPIYREGLRPLEDIEKGIALLNPGPGDEIRLSDSLPGRISEGEALLHPDILKVLKIVRDKFPNNVMQITTNGTSLTKDFIEKLIPYKPLKFTISYHSDNPKYWCKIFNLGLDKFKIAGSAFFHLVKNGFLVEGTMVPLPGFVGYGDIENTIKFIKCFTMTIIVYAPGYSFGISDNLKRKMNTDYRELSRFLIKMRKKYRVNLELTTDLLKPLAFFPNEVMLNSFGKKFKNCLWLFSEAAYEKAGKILSEWNDFVPNEHYASMVKNHTYRGNIVCSGLLMVSDYRKAIKRSLSELKRRKVNIDLMILPNSSFDRYGDDLRSENYTRLTDEFQIPIWLR